MKQVVFKTNITGVFTSKSRRRIRRKQNQGVLTASLCGPLNRIVVNILTCDLSLAVLSHGIVYAAIQQQFACSVTVPPRDSLAQSSKKQYEIASVAAGIDHKTRYSAVSNKRRHFVVQLVKSQLNQPGIDQLNTIKMSLSLRLQRNSEQKQNSFSASLNDFAVDMIFKQRIAF